MSRTLLGLIVALCFLSAAGAGPSQAESRDAETIQIDVASFVEPATAVGLLLSADKTIQKLNPKIDRPQPGIITITIPFMRAELAPDTMATALVISDKGEVVFGNVKPVLDPDFGQSLAMIPLCPAEQVASASLAGQVSLLEELYRIRLKRRDQAKALVGQSLSEDFLARLQKLERGFGLAREKELNSELPALDLIDRLTRLRDALRNWEKKVEPTPRPESAAQPPADGALSETQP